MFRLKSPPEGGKERGRADEGGGDTERGNVALRTGYCNEHILIYLSMSLDTGAICIMIPD